MKPISGASADSTGAKFLSALSCTGLLRVVTVHSKALCFKLRLPADQIPLLDAGRLQTKLSCCSVFDTRETVYNGLG